MKTITNNFIPRTSELLPATLIILLSFFIASQGRAQQLPFFIDTIECDVIPDSLAELQAMQGKLSQLEIKLESQRSDLRASLEQFSNPEFLLSEEEINDKIARLEKRVIAAEEAGREAEAERTRNEIDNWRSQLRSDKKLINWLSQVRDRLPKAEKVIELNRDCKLKVERKLSEVFNVEDRRQDFRKKISYAFCGLVAIVIVGFYVIAFRKDKIATAIFSGERGIQFITLFLIVIAIILFGIMGILESKELAALLGGLSGYILGRSSSRAALDK